MLGGFMQGMARGQQQQQAFKLEQFGLAQSYQRQLDQMRFKDELDRQYQQWQWGEKLRMDDEALKRQQVRIEQASQKLRQEYTAITGDKELSDEERRIARSIAVGSYRSETGQPVPFDLLEPEDVNVPELPAGITKMLQESGLPSEMQTAAALELLKTGKLPGWFATEIAAREERKREAAEPPEPPTQQPKLVTVIGEDNRLHQRIIDLKTGQTIKDFGIDEEMEATLDEQVNEILTKQMLDLVQKNGIVTIKGAKGRNTRGYNTFTPEEQKRYWDAMRENLRRVMIQTGAAQPQPQAPAAPTPQAGPRMEQAGSQPWGDTGRPATTAPQGGSPAPGLEWMTQAMGRLEGRYENLPTEQLERLANQGDEKAKAVLVRRMSVAKLVEAANQGEKAAQDELLRRRAEKQGISQ